MSSAGMHMGLVAASCLALTAAGCRGSCERQLSIDTTDAAVHAPPSASSVALVGGSRDPDPVKALEQRAYVVTLHESQAFVGTTAGIVAWDVADPARPARLGSAMLQGSVNSIEALAVEKVTLAVTAGPTGLALIDVSQVKSGKLTILNEYPWPASKRGQCHSAWRYRASEKTKGFMACGTGGVAAVDLSDPAVPVVRAAVDAGGYVRDVAVLDESAGLPAAQASPNRVVAAAGTAGLAVIEFMPTPRLVATLAIADGDARSVAVQQGIAYVAAGPAGLVMVDLKAPKVPVLLGSFDPKTTDMARGVVAIDGNAYVCLGDSGLVIVDVKDPRAPGLIGSHDPLRALNRAFVALPLLFGANDADGLLVLNVSKPASLVQVYPAPKKDDAP